MGLETVKLTPYRPAFDINPEDERMLPEVAHSPFTGIPVDEYEKNIITIESDEEEDFDTWRGKETEREAISISGTPSNSADISDNIAPSNAISVQLVKSQTLVARRTMFIQRQALKLELLQ